MQCLKPIILCPSGKVRMDKQSVPDAPTQCPRWIKRVILTVGCSLPVFRDKQTFSESVGMSQRCQQRTYISATRLTSVGMAENTGDGRAQVLYA